MGTSTIEVTAITTALQQNVGRNITRDSNGVFHIVYYESDGSYFQIYYEKSTDEGLTWTGRTALTSGSYDQVEPAICVDSNDNLHVVWGGKHAGKASYYDLRYIKYTGSWGSISNIGNSTYDEWRPSICVDSSDYLHVVWRRNTVASVNNHRLDYSKYITSWSTPIEVSSDNYNQGPASLTVDDNDYIHMTWVGGSSSFPSVNNTFYRKYTTSWQTIVRITAQNRQSASGHAILESDGTTIWLIWHGRSPTSTTYTQIIYAKYTGSWGSSVDITSGSIYCRQPSPLINTSDDITVPYRYQSTPYELHKVIWNGSSWTDTAETSGSSNNQDLPESFYSYHPSAKSNIPVAGYAYAWMDSTTIKFKYSADLSWGGVAHEKKLTETISISDSVITQAAYDRQFTETINVSDSLSTQAAFYKSLSETISISDSFSIQMSRYKKLTETITISDSIAAGMVWYKKLVEAINIVDILTVGGIKRKFLTETISISDSISTQSAFRRTFTETVDVADSISAQVLFRKQLVETISISDSISTQAVLRRKLTEILNISDSYSTQTSYVRKFTETLSLIDTISKGVKKTLTETLSITDAITANRSIHKKLTETLSISDSFSRVVEYHRTFTESIDISDEVNVAREVMGDFYLWPTAKMPSIGKAYQLRNFTIKLSADSGSTISGELAEEVE